MTTRLSLYYLFTKIVFNSSKIKLTKSRPSCMSFTCVFKLIHFLFCFFAFRPQKQDEGQKVVELTLHQGGVFVVTYLPKKEKFELTPNGSLYTSRLCRFCTVRCPRKAVETTVSCSLKVRSFTKKKRKKRLLQYCLRKTKIAYQNIRQNLL